MTILRSDLRKSPVAKDMDLPYLAKMTWQKPAREPAIRSYKHQGLPLFIFEYQTSSPLDLQLFMNSDDRCCPRFILNNSSFLTEDGAKMLWKFNWIMPDRRLQGAWRWGPESQFWGLTWGRAQWPRMWTCPTWAKWSGGSPMLTWQC